MRTPLQNPLRFKIPVRFKGVPYKVTKVADVSQTSRLPAAPKLSSGDLFSQFLFEYTFSREFSDIRGPDYHPSSAIFISILV